MSDVLDQQYVYMKYTIGKSDGSPVDPEACYFVLRLDADDVAREAMRVYAKKCSNKKLANSILRCLDWLDDPPSCTCGGRDWDAMCAFHGDSLLADPVWRHGGSNHDTATPNEDER